MHRKLNSVLAATLVLAPVLATAGCGGVAHRDRSSTVSADGTEATRTREQVRTTSDGAVVREVETQKRTVIEPAPNSTPDAAQRDATKSQ